MENLCRICQSTDSVEELTDFYSDPKLVSDFYFITGIVITSIASFNPSLICSTCIDTIKIFTKFKRKARKSDNFFRNRDFKSESKFWTSQKSDQLDPHPLIKEEPEVIQNISYFADVASITKFHHENDSASQSDDENASDYEKKQSQASSQVECKICHKRVSSKRILNLHMSVAHNADNKVYVCKHCEKIFKHETYIKKHVRKSHQLVYMKSRDAAVKILKGSSKKVKKKEVDPRVFEDCNTNYCKICNREFSSIRTCRDHMKIAHGNDKSVFLCKLCERRFKLKEYILRHLRNKHDQDLTDENHEIIEEEDEEDEYEEIDSKIVEIAKPVPLKVPNYCNQCMRPFASRRSFLEHMKVRHKTDDNVYVCKFCDREFIVLSYLKRHAREDHDYSIKPHEVIIKTEGDVAKGKKRKRMKQVKRKENDLLGENDEEDPFETTMSLNENEQLMDL